MALRELPYFPTAMSTNSLYLAHMFSLLSCGPCEVSLLLSKAGPAACCLDLGVRSCNCPLSLLNLQIFPIIPISTDYAVITPHKQQPQQPL